PTYKLIYPDGSSPGTGIVSNFSGWPNGCWSVSQNYLTALGPAGTYTAEIRQYNTKTRTTVLRASTNFAANVSCGNNHCEAGETPNNCSPDCGPVCGDGLCNWSETCSSCAADCGVCPCGDGTCNAAAGETCDTCSADCGQCVCGDGICNGAED